MEPGGNPGVELSHSHPEILFVLLSSFDDGFRFLNRDGNSRQPHEGSFAAAKRRILVNG